METDFIDDFIEEYKKQPCLWQASSADFKNRKKRQEAYQKLIEVANKHGEHYNIERTKQKINNLRCAFRHQLRKFTESKNKTSGKEDTYCPKRRYFESLMFLLNEERPERAKPELKVDDLEKPISIATTNSTEYSMSGEVEETVKNTSAEIVIQTTPQPALHTVQTMPTSKEELVFESPASQQPKESRVHFEVQSSDDVNFLWPRISRATKPAENSIIHMAASEIVEQQEARPPSACSQTSLPSTHSENAPKKVKIDCSATDFQKLLNLACSKSTIMDSRDDNYSIFGKMVAYKLRSMDAQQCMIAEKLITDILIDGQMKMLTYPSRTTIPYRQDTGHAFVISGLNINGTTEATSDRAQQYSTQTIQYSTGNGSQI